MLIVTLVHWGHTDDVQLCFFAYGNDKRSSKKKMHYLCNVMTNIQISKSKLKTNFVNII